MAKLVVMGAMLKCNFGMAPSSLMIVDPRRATSSGKFIGNIADNKPMVNIMPFGMCQSLANPSVASATAAAMGALTPMPCMPVISAPWMPGGKELISGKPGLLDNCKCMCNWGGVIEITNPGNTRLEG